MRPELQDAIRIARRAGRILTQYYTKPYTKSRKADQTWVTEADIQSQQYISRELGRKYAYPILSEELVDDTSRLKRKRVWIVDPLDGTNNFIEKSKDFSVLIGLSENGKPVLGVVYIPMQNVIYYAEQGKGAYKRVGNQLPVQIHVSSRSKTSEIHFVMGPRYMVPKDRIAAVRSLGVKKIYYVGSCGIRLVRIAEGTADVYVYPRRIAKGGEWDTCAPEIILKEAGGKITDCYGQRFKYNKRDVKHRDGLVASNNILHSWILKKIKPYIVSKS